MAPKKRKQSGDEAASLLECPVCCELMIDRLIFQCEKGHVLCETCKASLPGGIAGPNCKKCPSCRQKLGEIRNRALEAMAEVTEISCPHEACSFKGKGAAFKAHEEKCEHRPYSCPLEFKHSSCNWSGSKDEVVSHISSHGAPTFTCINGRVFVPLDPGCPDCVWNSLVKHENEVFLLTVRHEVHIASKNVFWIFLRRVNGHSALQYSVTVKKEGNSRKRSADLVASSIRLKESEIVACEDALAVPECTAFYFAEGAKEMKDMKWGIDIHIKNDRFLFR